MYSFEGPFFKGSTLTYRTKNRLQNVSEAGFLLLREPVKRVPAGALACAAVWDTVFSFLMQYFLKVDV